LPPPNRRLRAFTAAKAEQKEIIMNIIKTLREANKIAVAMGLVRGKGSYNGAAFWVRPGSDAIITRDRLAELAGLV
jgi:hypothetical protein